MTIQEAVKEIISQRGIDIFKNSKIFFASIDDLAPEYQKERRILRRNVDESVLNLFIDNTLPVNTKLLRIKTYLEDYGLTDDSITFIIETFGIPLGYEKTIEDLKTKNVIAERIYAPAPQINNTPQKVEEITLNDETLKLLGYNNKNIITKISIPDVFTTYSGTAYKITSIVDEVFKNCTSLTHVVIPKTVNTIGNNAFDSCTSLKQVTIPDSVKSIGESAFKDCTLLTVITIPNGITEIKKETFCNCKSLVILNMADTVNEIGECAFKNCESLSKITLPNGITKLSKEIFCGCKSLINIDIPDSVTEIEEMAFKDCELLNNLVIPKKIANFGLNLFEGCKNLESVTIPAKFIVDLEKENQELKVEQIDLLWDIVDLEEKNKSLKFKLEEEKYNKQNRVKDEIDYEVSEINDEDINKHIEKVHNTQSVQQKTQVPIESRDRGFRRKDGSLVTSVESRERKFRRDTLNVAQETEHKKESIDEISMDDTLDVQLDVQNDKQDINTAIFNVEVLKSLGYDIIQSWRDRKQKRIIRKEGKEITSFDIPSTYIQDGKEYKIDQIGDNVFEYCKSLTNITIPNSVTQIGDSAFEYCEALTSITIPNSVTQIGDSAFKYCEALTNVTIPTSVTQIGDNVFEYCKSLTNITIPNSVTQIGDSAFKYCEALTSVTIPNSVTQIGNNAFCNCKALTTVTIPNSVKEIDYMAFYRCESLSSITIPDSVTQIGSRAFQYCESLSSITIPDSVTQIDFDAFEDIPHIEYYGTATGAPWGAKSMN